MVLSLGTTSRYIKTGPQMKSKNILDQCITKNKTGSFHSISQENLKWEEKGQELGQAGHRERWDWTQV